MELTIDKAGRVVLPKAMREALGLGEGGVVDATLYGTGIQLVAGGRTARVVPHPDGGLVAESETVVDTDSVLDLIDAGRR